MRSPWFCKQNHTCAQGVIGTFSLFCFHLIICIMYHVFKACIKLVNYEQDCSKKYDWSEMWWFVCCLFYVHVQFKFVILLVINHRRQNRGGAVALHFSDWGHGPSTFLTESSNFWGSTSPLRHTPPIAQTQQLALSGRFWSAHDFQNVAPTLKLFCHQCNVRLVYW